MSYIQGYDPHTLREIVDVSQCRERLGELGDQRSLPALLERVWLLKVTGEFDEALAVSEQSVRVARMGCAPACSTRRCCRPARRMPRRFRS